MDLVEVRSNSNIPAVVLTLYVAVVIELTTFFNIQNFAHAVCVGVSFDSQMNAGYIHRSINRLICGTETQWSKNWNFKHWYMNIRLHREIEIFSAY